MALNILHDATVHTNGRLGMFFSQTEIIIMEVHELKGDVQLEEVASGTVQIDSVLAGNVEVDVGS